VAYQAHAQIATYVMTKRDNEKDSERPHYYSQFWLDVAAGRRIIGTPKLNEEGEQTDAELVEPVLHPTGEYVSSLQQSTTISRVATNGRTEEIVSPEVEDTSDEEYAEPEEELDLAFSDLEDQDLPVEEADIPDMDLSTTEEEDFIDEDESGEEEELAEEELEEEEVDWGRGRKKPKSSRPTKTSTKKPIKRDSRRGGY
jgi:hypothetical protein